MHIQAFLWYTHVYTFRRWNLLHAFKSNNPQTLRCTCRGPKTSRSNLAPSTVTSLQSIFFDPIHSTHEKTTPPLNFVEPLVEWKTRVTRSGWKVCREWLKLWGPTKVPENEIQWKPCCTSGTTCATQYLLCEQGFLWRAPSTLYRPAAVASISLPLYIPWIPEKKWKGSTNLMPSVSIVPGTSQPNRLTEHTCKHQPTMECRIVTRSPAFAARRPSLYS